MSDERPRPAYGEYATPEQQAAAIGAPPVVPPVVHPHPTAALPPYGQAANGQGAITARHGSRRWDLFLTSLLLAYGLWSVISGFVQYSNLTTVAQTFYASQGIGTFASSRPGLATPLGLVINISDVVVFILVAYIAFRLLKRGKVAFYVPLIGGIVTTIIAAVCLVTFLFTDPGFATYLSQLGSGG